jgi:hypothetical protein
MWAWLAIGIVGVYIYRKYTSGSTASTAASAATTAASSPTETVSLPSGASYSGPAGVDLSGLLNAPAAGTSNPASSVPTETISLPGGGSYSGPVGSPDLSVLTASGPAPGTAAATPGNGGGTPGQAAFATIPIGGSNPGQYIDLGQLAGQGWYTGENVGGGAPVFFGNADQVSEVSGPAAIGNLPAGTHVYTPAAYGPQVNPAVVNEHL